MSFQATAAGLRNRLANLFVDREFFMRADGAVRFIRISAKLQKRVAAVAALALLMLLLVSGAAMVGLWSGPARSKARWRRARPASPPPPGRWPPIADRWTMWRGIWTPGRIGSSGCTKGHFGPLDGTATDTAKPDASLKKIGLAIPEAAPLARLEARQFAFVDGLSRLADQRASRAEAAIRKFGINPRQFLSGERASGGPLIRAGNRKSDFSDPRFAKLAGKLGRMDSLERLLAAIPTSKPAAITAMTSNFGYRRDPFTGEGAMHSGIDFHGPSGTPILAASDGRISFAGTKGGYGNCIEITHSGGIVTRYAHMRRLIARIGQKVARGQEIGEMGSTGRSTGTHLHFEVRLNGQAVNPAKFLKANPDIFKLQAAARNRTRAEA